MKCSLGGWLCGTLGALLIAACDAGAEHSVWQTVCEASCARHVECLLEEDSMSDCVSNCLSDRGQEPCARNQDILDVCLSSIAIWTCENLEVYGLPHVCDDVCSGCQSDDECHDDHECTTDSCDPDGTCANVPLADGTPCAVGTCQQGLCAGRFLCDETGINEAIAAGEGPHTFDCDGPTTIVTRSEILIHSEVILDGEANLTLDGDGDHPVFSMSLGVTAELRGFTVTGGKDCGIRIRGPLTIANSIVSGNAGAGVCNGQEAWYDSATIVDSVVSGNDGRGVSNAVSSLSLRNTTVSENRGGGISNYVGTISIRDSTISLNSGDEGGGIYSEAHYTGPDEAHLLTKSPYNSYVAIINSTISGNSAARGGAVFNSDRWADMTMINVTIARNTTSQGSDIYSDSNLVVANTLIDGDCAIDPLGRMASDGYSIESPGDTCGLDGGPDQVNVSAEDLKLGPLADNGGPTMTHALGPGSIAIDRTPAPSCLDTDDERLTEDQRGEPRPETPDSMCDVGAFERQPED